MGINQKVKEYFDKQPSPQKEICIKLREIIIKIFPNITEEMKWGVPVYGNEKFYIGSFKHSVNLGFNVKGLTPQELNLFEGSGKFMRHIKIRTLEDIDERNIVKLLQKVSA
ncbi:MAG: DUF1801 domain-containing protein [Candidatus Lokiarchaeota archaeon]|nr:DUF1801 domain-containing protein [Candidatus Lokiarchaeota archaeon]